MPAVSLDESVGSLLLKYARLVVGRGYIHNSLGNIAIRVPTPTSSTGWPTRSTRRSRSRR